MVGPYIKFISNSSLMTIFIRAFCRAIFLIILDILINIIFLLKPISSHFFFFFDLFKFILSYRIKKAMAKPKEYFTFLYLLAIARKAFSTSNKLFFIFPPVHICSHSKLTWLIIVYFIFICQ